MREHQGRFDLAGMGEALGVSPSGYYHWIEAKPSIRRQHNERIRPKIEDIVHSAHSPHGYRPVHQHLLAQGVTTSSPIRRTNAPTSLAISYRAEGDIGQCFIIETANMPHWAT